jgi:hypothetical protein
MAEIYAREYLFQQSVGDITYDKGRNLSGTVLRQYPAK